ncbi:MAG: hypothetical protein Q8K99_05525 [Actinomycetota bacterium]|nr:hypothetical protein [Actinomycetota bacterium]
MEELRTLESTLKDVEGRIANASKSTKRVTSALNAAAKASAHGDIAALRRALGDASESLRVAQLDTGTAVSSWRWEEEAEQEYFRSGLFVQELLAAAVGKVEIQEDEGVLVCYPSMLRVDPVRRAVLIDKKPWKSVRPSVLISHLADVQGRPPRFKPTVFLESLYMAWDYARHLARGMHEPARDMRVDRVYAALTIAPGSAKEYSKQEFGRDLYLLERAGVRETKKGARLSFSRSTGTKAGAGVISVVGEDGRQVLYSSISFVEAG